MATTSATRPHGNDWRTNATLLLGGQFMSLLGSNLVQYAIWWDLAIRSNSGVTIMWATIFGMLPQACISVVAGAWADRLPRRLLINLPDAAIAAITLCLAIAYATGNARTWFVFLVLFIRSVGSGIQQPAVNAFIPEVTPTHRLMRVNAVNGTLQSVLTVAAPAISAVLIGRFALQSVLFVDVTTAIIGIVCILLIRLNPQRQDPAVEPAPDPQTFPEPQPSPSASSPCETETSAPGRGATSPWGDIREGVMLGMRHPTLRRMLIGYALTCLIAVAPSMLCSIFVTRNFADEPFDLWLVRLSSITDKLGFFELTFGIGMVTGGLVMTAWGGFKRRMLSLGVSTVGLGMANVIMALSARSITGCLWLFALSFILFGLMLPLANAPSYTYIQETVEPLMQGRVFGLLNMAMSLSTPLGMLLAGPLADMVPIEGMLIVSGMAVMAAGVWIAWPREDRHGPSDTGQPHR